MTLELVELRERDFQVVKEIYDYYILNSTYTFHTEALSIQELKEIILTGHPKYKSFLIHYNGNAAGYCYISQYKKKQAYYRTAEITLYLKPGYTEIGIGSQVIRKLETVAGEVGIFVLIAIMSGENERSIKLFEACGFEKCAHFRKVGEKFNQILDVFAYQKILDQQS